MSTTLPPDERKISLTLDRLLMHADEVRASDIHIEPLDDCVQVRFRIDGQMVRRQKYPAEYKSPFLTRLKVMAGLDIAERRLPQDGVFHAERGKKEVDYRISTFPTEFGEKIVLRLLQRSAEMKNLDQLGVGSESVALLKQLIARPNGILLVTGPTGSGKTTLLYALLGEVDRESLNVVTLEDPIESRIPGVTQGQANKRIGFDFAAGLRSILRQDPDVIMVGEVRDTETAQVAFRAALTGHLVLSTLHTNSAAETITRLIDMGVERFVVASAMRAVVSQRLVRQLCEVCREPDDYHPESLDGVHLHADQHFFRPKGCAHCAQTGYRGRTGLYEVVAIDEGLSELIKSDQAGSRDYLKYMERSEVPSLRQEGILTALKGITSLTEVMRVT